MNDEEKFKHQRDAWIVVALFFAFLIVVNVMGGSGDLMPWE